MSGIIISPPIQFNQSGRILMTCPNCQKEWEQSHISAASVGFAPIQSGAICCGVYSPPEALKLNEPFPLPQSKWETWRDRPPML